MRESSRVQFLIVVLSTRRKQSLDLLKGPRIFGLDRVFELGALPTTLC